MVQHRFFLSALALSLSMGMGCAVAEETSVVEPGAQEVDPTADIESDGPTLRLSQVPSEDERLVVDLSYHPSPGVVGPRVMELWLGVGSGLIFESGESLGATADAGKLFVARSEEAGLRVVVLSTSNLTPLQPGKVGRLFFRRAPSGAKTLSVQERMPIFAPAEANEGLSLPDLLTLTGGGTP